MEALAGDMSYLFDNGYVRMNNAMMSMMPATPLPVMPANVKAPMMPAQVKPVAPNLAVGEWDDAAFDTLNFELDLGFDTFLLATADDFMEPFSNAAQNAQPASPQMFGDHSDCSSSCPSESEASVADEEAPAAHVMVEMPAKRSRKRKNPDSVQMTATNNNNNSNKPVVMTTKAAEKKSKLAPHKTKTFAAISPEAERLYRRRYDILHEILEAWNTGGIEDMEEIADDVYDSDVTLVSPDYSEGLKGVQALMHHWTLLLDSFPDGIMEEYNIERDDAEGQKMNVTWVFSGTQIFPFFGVEPRHEKVTIRGSSFFTFKGEKISQMVLSWNYREALMQLMGVKPSKATADRR